MRCECRSADTQYVLKSETLSQAWKKEEKEEEQEGLCACARGRRRGTYLARNHAHVVQFVHPAGNAAHAAAAVAPAARKDGTPLRPAPCRPRRGH